MLNFSKIKIFTIYLILLILSSFSLLNLQNENFSIIEKKVNLGLDLQGGSYLLLEIDTKPLLKERLQEKIIPLKKVLTDNNIEYSNFNIKEEIISFDIKDDKLSKFEALFNKKEKNNINPYIQRYNTHELKYLINNNSLQISFSKYGKLTINNSALNQSIEIVRRRIDETGTNEPSIQQQGADRIIVQLPGLDDPSRIKKLLGKTAKLTFQLAHPTIFPDDLDKNSKAPPGYVKLQEDKNPDRFYMINKRIMVSGEMLKDASPTFDRNNSPSVSFQLSPLGGKKFGRVTGKHVGRAFAIVLDGKVVSAPVIQTQIFSTGQITGAFSVQETNDLALVLRSGALPAPMVILEERSVGPGLGSDSISSGKIASVFGLIAVMVFMLITYGMFGIFANVALICNIIFIIALLSLIQATLTLPGIAGIVLTMGMAVDANVLIFERIKEEFNSGRNILDAIEAGFQRAISTIVDANLTTLFAALALFSFGSGPIKGFSVTLMIGIATSMFTAIVITKYIVFLYSKKKDINSVFLQG